MHSLGKCCDKVKYFPLPLIVLKSSLVRECAVRYISRIGELFSPAVDCARMQGLADGLCLCHNAHGGLLHEWINQIIHNTV